MFQNLGRKDISNHACTNFGCNHCIDGKTWHLHMKHGFSSRVTASMVNHYYLNQPVWQEFVFHVYWNGDPRPSRCRYDLVSIGKSLVILSIVHYYKDIC